MDQVQLNVSRWARDTFPAQTLESITRHLLSEAAELCFTLGIEEGQALDILTESYEKCRGKERRGEMFTAREELADVLILGLVGADYDAASAEREINRKMVRNRARKWGELNANGFHEHIEAGS